MSSEPLWFHRDNDNFNYVDKSKMSFFTVASISSIVLWNVAEASSNPKSILVFWFTAWYARNTVVCTSFLSSPICHFFELASKVQNSVANPRESVHKFTRGIGYLSQMWQHSVYDGRHKTKLSRFIKHGLNKRCPFYYYRLLRGQPFTFV